MQKPRIKPDKEHRGSDGTIWFSCGCGAVLKAWERNCPVCGEELDWSDVERTIRELLSEYGGR